VAAACGTTTAVRCERPCERRCRGVSRAWRRPDAGCRLRRAEAETIEPAGASKQRRDASDDEEHAARAGRSSQETGVDDAEPEGEHAKVATQGAERTTSEQPESERAGSYEGQDNGSAALEQPESPESGEDPEPAEPEEPELEAPPKRRSSEDEPEETEPPA
jgi:hypothetical protein